MKKDISKPLHSFIKDFYSHRDDISIQITKQIKRKENFYSVLILIHIKPNDGLYDMINKGIDRTALMNEIKGYFNLNWDNCMIYYQNVYPETIYQIDI
jgi:hypothetical protein